MAFCLYIFFLPFVATRKTHTANFTQTVLSFVCVSLSVCERPRKDGPQGVVLYFPSFINSPLAVASFARMDRIKRGKEAVKGHERGEKVNELKGNRNNRW